MKSLSKTDTVIRLGRLNKQIVALKNSKHRHDVFFDLSYIKYLAVLTKRRTNLEQIVRRETEMYVDSNGHLKRMS